MAKSSRGRGRKSSRRNVDWVVVNDSYGQVASIPNATQIAIALTLPKFWAGGIDPNLGVPVPNYSYPEQDSGQVAYAVRGHLGVVPGTWAVGSRFRLWVRLVVKPIEYDTAGVPIVIEDPNYSLVNPVFANERFLSQWVKWEDFGQGTAGEIMPISWKGQVRIPQDAALWMYLENQSGITQTLACTPFLRTLMRADG